uniref:Uncharacterized protein n=1 Tax=Candidatus Kentrum sp. UNK TaxID=2126344 RepID=A0A451AU77_9GAMM|nr:MAG: hypothetical protein BECKUNK1418G_GA0071005_101313 [Candidatus Kentron sp. UNK]VFK69457.1 MAG: hypothetical protein BECKUNK1418H_GA0071006_101413 [Candidatus Kentron sp. UNK]
MEQHYIPINKKPLQIFILMDLMMLMVFMLLSKPDSEFPGNFVLDASGGYMDGTKISLHGQYDDVLASLISEDGRLAEVEEESISSFFVGVDCWGGVCKEKIPSDIPFQHAKIYFPDKVMTLVYSLASNYCKELKCDGRIYIRSGTGEVFLCSEKDKYFYTILDGELVADDKCKPNLM